MPMPMPLLSNKNKSQRPKFLLNLKIDELINIPQSSGYCYVKWNLKEGTGVSNHRLRSGGEDENNLVGHQSHGATPKVAVENHRARWNYQLTKPIEVKLLVDKNRNLESKRLVLDIYFEFVDSGADNSDAGSSEKKKREGSLDSSNAQSQPPRIHTSHSYSVLRSTNNVYSPKVSSKSRLGSVSINIADYVRADEQPVTNRFLLKKSKINSIINVTIQMALIRGSYADFQLSKASNNQLTRSGIDDILDEGSEKSSPVSSPIPSSATSGKDIRRPYPRPPNLRSRSMRSSLRFTSANAGNNNNNNNNNNNSNNTSNNNHAGIDTNVGEGIGIRSHSYSAMGSPSSHGNTISSSMNPLVMNLYQKTFQLPWDPRPGEFTPKECVEDILQGGNGWARNEKGISLIDIQALKLLELEVKYQDSHKYGVDVKINSAKPKRVEKDASGDEYNSMDRREFLEKMRTWSSASQNQKRFIGGASNGIPVIDEDVEGLPESIRADQIRDARTWTINHALV